jgi:PAS domain-containing protein
MMPGGFFSYVNDESERIILANEALLDIFECSNMDEFKDLTSNSFKGLVHKDDYERVENEINNQILNSSKKYDRVKYRIITKTGKVKTVVDYGHLVEKEFNDDIFYVFIVEEI